MKSFNLAIVLVYGAIVLVLTGVGIWDVTKIITDYITDNRITLVKLENITEKYPFITEVQFCLNYASESLDDESFDFHEIEVYSIFEILLYLKNKEELSYTRFVNESLHRWISMTEHSDINTKSNFTNDLTILFLTQLARLLDDNDPEYLKYYLHESYMAIPETVLLATVDSFITYPESDKLVKAAWNFLQSLFIIDRNLEPVLSYFDDAAKADGICFHISDWTIDQPLVSYYVDMLYKRILNTNSSYVNSSAYLEISVSGQPVSISGIKAQPNNGQIISIAIVNNGMFDSSEFPPCTLDFTNEDQCMYNVMAVTITEICGCTRISDVLSNESHRDNRMKINKYDRFCTSQIYEQCWDQVLNETKKNLEAAKNSKKCVPCKSFKNAFQVSTRAYEPTERYLLPLGRFKVNFMITDRTVMVFHEHPQFTVPQLISQVGGDLGLYIGFSMLSILEILLFIYSAWNRARTASNNNLDGANVGHGRFGWFHSVAAYVDRKFHHEGQETCSVHKEENAIVPCNLRNTTLSKDWVLDLVNASQQELLKKMNDLADKMDRTAQVVSELQAQQKMEEMQKKRKK